MKPCDMTDAGRRRPVAQPPAPQRGVVDVRVLADWWRGRPRREQAVLAVGAAVVLVGLVWALVWSPIEQRRAGLIDALNAALAERAELDARAPAVAALSEVAVSGSGTAVDQRSLPALIDADLRRAGLAASIREVAPEGERLRVRLEAVDYRAMLVWLDALLVRDGLDVVRFEARARAEPGRVDAELAFAVPGANHR